MKLLPSFFSDRWQEASAAKDEIILKLGILRDFSRQVHAERSVSLARGSVAELQRLEKLDQNLNSLLTSREETLKIPLEQLLENSASHLEKAPPSSFPAEFVAIIPKEKLERYDRKWELVISRQCLKQGWKFWKLESAVAIPEVEVFHNGLAQSLWPNGVLLFAESAAPLSSPQSRWSGRWVIAARPFWEPNHLPSPYFELGANNWELLFPTS